MDLIPVRYPCDRWDGAEEQLLWCLEIFPEEEIIYEFSRQEDFMIFYFKNENLASLFVLRWL